MLATKITVGEAISLINNSIAEFQDGLPTDIVNDIIYSINNELQVRDYILGLPSMHSMETSIKFVSYIGESVDGAERYSLMTILSAFYYELGDTDMASILLAVALDTKSDYALANLIERVINSGWPSGAFATMRSELHPKVMAMLDEIADQLI